MKLNFEINVECKGNAAGTLGWLNEILSRTELVIKNNKDGVSSLFAKTKRIDSDKPIYQFICKVDHQNTNHDDCWLYDQKTYKNTRLSVIKIYEDMECDGFFGLKLTPAAENKFEDFLDKACERFAEWWENDSE